MNDKQRMWRLAGRYSSVGIEIAAALLIGIFSGQWIDNHFASAPYGVLTGGVIGLGACVQAIRRIIKQSKRDHLS